MLDLISNQKISMPKAIIFDTDNTLYSYEPAHKAAIKSVAIKVKELFGINEIDFMGAYKTSRTEIKECLENTASSHSRLLYFQKTIERLDMGTRILTTLDLEQTYWRTFLANAMLFPGVKEFLQQLQNNGVKTANITDLTAQIQFRKMVYFGLDEYFDYVVTSEESGCDKPDIRPFKMALNKLKIGPENVWMIGDSPESDIYGAKTHFKMMTLQKIHKGVKVGIEQFSPDISFNHYSELIKLIKNLPE